MRKIFIQLVNPLPGCMYFVSVGRPRKAKSQTSSPAKNFSNESSKVDAVAGNNPAFLSRVQFKCEP